MEDLNTRYVVESRLLGIDESCKKKRKEIEYAVEVVLSDESKYTMFRSLKVIAVMHSKLMARFPVEAGYFKKDERVIPDCPVKQSVFGPQRIVRDDRSFERLLNSYIKEIPGLPAALVKSDIVSDFYSLKASDINDPTEDKKKRAPKREKPSKLDTNSSISAPMSLKSYYAVAGYTDKKTKFSFPEGSIVQVIQKDPSGWWMVDAGGVSMTGWAPASYLVPMDDNTMDEEAEENEQLIGGERVGTRYISISSYQSSRDDELSFVKGAVVRLIKKYIDGWWLVRYNGGEGHVPGALFRKFDRRQATLYVNKIKRRYVNRKSTRVIPTMKPKWMATERRHNPRQQNTQGTSTTEPTEYRCKASFQGNPEKFEASIKKNEIVKVLDKQDSGWWYMQDGQGRCGWVPASYLESVDESKVENSSEIEGTKYEACKAHRAHQPDELDLNRGDEVLVIRASRNGWWTVKNPKTMRQGLVPSSCLSPPVVKDSQQEAKSPSSPPPSQLSPVTAMVEDASTMNSKAFDKSFSNGTSLESIESDDVSLDDFDLDNDDDDLDLEDCYVATRDYVKLSMDELDVYEGQMVCAIDDTDKDLWYVNADGKEGWIPSSILRVMTEEEMLGGALSSRDTSRESTPMDATGTSAENSDVSDTDELTKLTGLISPPTHAFKRSRVVRKSRTTETCTYEDKKGSRSRSQDPSNRRNGVQQQHSIPVQSRKISWDNGSDSDACGSSASVSSPVRIIVDNKTIEQLEREAADAERIAREAKMRAHQLKQKVAVARKISSGSGVATSDSP